MNPKGIRIPRLPIEGSTFTTSRHNLMPNHRAVMVKKMFPSPIDRRKTAKKALMAINNFSLFLIWVLRPVIWLQFFICGCLFQIIKLFL